jgi:hypothetical protein
MVYIYDYFIQNTPTVFFADNSVTFRMTLLLKNTIVFCK